MLTIQLTPNLDIFFKILVHCLFKIVDWTFPTSKSFFLSFLSQSFFCFDWKYFPVTWRSLLVFVFLMLLRFLHFFFLLWLFIFLLLPLPFSRKIFVTIKSDVKFSIDFLMLNTGGPRYLPLFLFAVLTIRGLWITHKIRVTWLSADLELFKGKNSGPPGRNLRK